MNNEKLIVNRCFRLEEPDLDDLWIHRWAEEPAIGLTEAGPIAWWICTRCPARTLHDPETEDGFAPEPIVVYPPSCFGEDEIEPGREMVDPFQRRWTVQSVDAPEEQDRAERLAFRVAGSGPLVVLHAAGGGTLTVRASILNDWTAVPCCPCPRRASGAREHLDGCTIIQANVEAVLRSLDEEVGSIWPLSLAGVIVHPPTDPAPPSEELMRAIEELDEDDVPTIPRATIFGHPLDPATA